MKTVFTLLILIATISIGDANDMVMRDYGVYSFKGEDFDVIVELAKVAENGLAPKITFKDGDKEVGSTGIGKGSSLTVIPGHWAAQFRPPYELWIYDGTSKLQLYERTMEPIGFKASSSSVVPELRDRAPEVLKKLTSKHTD